MCLQIATFDLAREASRAGTAAKSSSAAKASDLVALSVLLSIVSAVPARCRPGSGLVREQTCAVNASGRSPFSRRLSSSGGSRNPDEYNSRHWEQGTPS
jgi:hypothetical protein